MCPWQFGVTLTGYQREKKKKMGVSCEGGGARWENKSYQK